MGEKLWARDVIGLFGTKMVLFPLGLITGILVTRVLGPADKGVFAFVTLLIGFVGPLLQFGFGNGIRYYVSAGEFHPRDVAFSAFVTRLFLGVMAAVVLGVLYQSHALGETASVIRWSELLPVLACLPLVGAGTVMQWILIGDSQFNVVNFLDMARSALLIILLWAMVVLGHLGLVGAIWSLLVGQVAVALAMCGAVVGLYRPRLRIDARAIVQSFSYGIRMWIGTIAVRSNNRLDQFVLAVSASASQLGQYSVAVRVAELPLMLGSVSGPVVFNRIATSAADEDRVGIVDRVHRAQTGLVGGVLLALGLVGYLTIPVLYGQAFKGAVVPFLLYLPGVLAYASQQVIGKYFSGSGHPLVASILQVVGLGVGLPAYLVLIPRYGAKGASIASSLVYSTTAVCGIVAYCRMARPQKARPLAFSGADWRWALGQLQKGLAQWSGSLGHLKSRIRGALKRS